MVDLGLLLQSTAQFIKRKEKRWDTVPVASEKAANHPQPVVVDDVIKAGRSGHYKLAGDVVNSDWVGIELINICDILWEQAKTVEFYECQNQGRQ